MADIIITNDDLKDPAIDDVVNLQKSVQSQGGQRVEEIKTPFYYNPVFYYTVAAAIGAVVVWGIFEPSYANTERTHEQSVPFLSDYLLFGPVAGMLGLSIGVIYGIVNRNWRQAFYCGSVGAGVSLAVTILTTFIADIVFHLITRVAFMSGDVSAMQDRLEHKLFPFTGIPFFIFMCGRGIAWSIVSLGAGMGLGVALKSKKLALNGFVGGLIGGLLGGLLFDPVSRFITPGAEVGTLSRCIGTLAVGTLVGVFIGIFENLSKDAWFLMLKGPLTGKQFILFKSPMNIGSSPKSDVYLFKDADIAPLHASVVKSGSRYMLKDEGSDKGTFVNGRKVDKYILQPNDVITIGEAVLKYAEKPK
ncbi:MAG TPA: FHA domain-containing protein [Planctomycetota bacterium]|nr:FHA domain-containing protein [Planctomycetota bacterium]